ncbi:hypothetical protein BKA65DRAFT_552180 [Rhexocercosporidium sp. MPI-PUGE-AT-0058]|nr:hypothetical protein BKA65DRAFT_552180 [Rhexocercosporidium sp. MPI-PUGE-AT-0058]
MSPFDKARLKAAKLWQAQNDYSTPVSPMPSIPVPTVDHQPVSRQDKLSARQRARLGIHTLDGPTPTISSESDSKEHFNVSQPKISEDSTGSEGHFEPINGKLVSIDSIKSPETPATLSNDSEGISLIPQSSNHDFPNEFFSMSTEEHASSNGHAAAKRKRTMSDSNSSNPKRLTSILNQSTEVIDLTDDSCTTQHLFDVLQQSGPLNICTVSTVKQSETINCIIILDDDEAPVQPPHILSSSGGPFVDLANVANQAANHNSGTNLPKKARFVEKRCPISMSEIAMGFTSHSNPLASFNRARRIPGTDIQPVLQPV